MGYNSTKLFVFAMFFFGITAANTSLLLGQDAFFQLTDTVIEEISPEMMQNEDKIIFIRDHWRFKAGDNDEWASPEYDDSEWDFVSTNLTRADLAFIDWNGLGWFRKKLNVHPDLRGKPMALVVDRHLGASQIYLNGVLIHELGTFSTDKQSVVPFKNSAPIAIVFSDDEVQTLAVRFINPQHVYTEMLMGYNGFRFLLGDWQTQQEQRFAFITGWTRINMFYVGMLLAFAVIHFLLFVFYPAEKRNLYFSIFVGFLVILSYLYFRMELSEHTTDFIFLIRYLVVATILALTFATKFTHSIDKKFAPFYSDFLVFFGLTISVLVWFFPGRMFLIRELTILIFVIEILRSVAVLIYKNRGGIWVLGVGVFIFVTSLVASILINVNLISGSAQIVNMAGAGGLVLSMSVFLSRDFALTQRNLKSKLEEVKLLSEKTIEQERINREKEIESRLLQAENERKTLELEEARALQLSMLPKKMPSVNGYDIAVFMETATEVGGDYYDYSIEQDGTLVLALGDATGHGMKAGIMVAAAKSYFHTLVHDADSLTLLQRMSNGLRNMDMKLMYMGFMLVQCKKQEFEIATAGMPPALYFSSRNKKVENIILKGLPLGSNVQYPYESRKVYLEKGDTLLMMSDGLMELFDPNREMLGIEKIEEVLKNSEGCSAKEIINQISQLIKQWSNGKEPEDDITVMVLKIPEQAY
jgi:serine phosphatase RsbU (regulator of sigma subunit)